MNPTPPAETAREIARQYLQFHVRPSIGTLTELILTVREVAQSTARAELQAEIDNIKQVEFPKRIANVSENWRKKVEAARAEGEAKGAAEMRASVIEAIAAYRVVHVLSSSGICAEIEQLVTALPLPAPAASQWRDISTAPREGHFLVCLANGWVTRGTYVSGRFFASEGSGPQHAGSDTTPTHWQPLPDAP